MKRKILIVEDNDRVCDEIKESLTLRYNNGYFIFENTFYDVYLTGELETAKDLIRDNVFDAYFLDNEIYSRDMDDKVLAQDILISIIMESDPLCPSEHPLYNISTHENESRKGKSVSGRCDKSGIAILRTIGDIYG